MALAGRLEDAKAVVTGSGGGMGGNIAVRLAEEGADVVLNDRLAEKMERYEAPIRALGRDVVAVHANVTRRDGAQQVIGAALGRWGRVDAFARGEIELNRRSELQPQLGARAQVTARRP